MPVSSIFVLIGYCFFHLSLKNLFRPHWASYFTHTIHGVRSMLLTPVHFTLAKATLRGNAYGYTESKETAKATAKNKIWIPVSSGITMHYSFTAHLFNFYLRCSAH
jgi:hypothetical protein